MARLGYLDADQNLQQLFGKFYEFPQCCPITSHRAPVATPRGRDSQSPFFQWRFFDESPVTCQKKAKPVTCLSHMLKMGLLTGLSVCGCGIHGPRIEGAAAPPATIQILRSRDQKNKGISRSQTTKPEWKPSKTDTRIVSRTGLCHGPDAMAGGYPVLNA